MGKNYLSQEELDELNRLVSMYLDRAENFARDIFQWDEGLGRKARWISEINAYDVLNNYGKVRRDTAERRAIIEYEKYRIIQDKEFKSYSINFVIYTLF